MKFPRCQFFSGISSLLLLWGSLVSAQNVHLSFNVVGPGAILTCCPEPNQAGQGYQIIAQPLANARFVRWEDGSTSSNRTFIVSPSQTTFTAWFEDVVQKPYLVEHGLESINPALHPVAGFVQDNSRLRLSFVLPGRNGYQVLGTTNLLTTAFAPVSFAVSANGPATLTQNFGEAGPLSLWIDPLANGAQSWFKILLDNQLSLPAIYFAQASIVRPSTAVLLFGDNLAGTVQATAYGTNLTAQAADSHSLSVTLPATPGVYPIAVKINGTAALGSVNVRVSTNATDFPTVSAPAAMTATAGGALEITGSGFTGTTEAFLDGQALVVAGVSSDGTGLVVRLPVGMTGAHSITLVRNGALSSLLNVTLVASSKTYTPSSLAGTRVYAWQAYQPNLYTLSPAGIKGLKVFSWQPYAPGTYSFTPSALLGVKLYAWQNYAPGTYSYVPDTSCGVKVYSWQTNSPGSLSYVPTVKSGVKVSAP